MATNEAEARAILELKSQAEKVKQDVARLEVRASSARETHESIERELEALGDVPRDLEGIAALRREAEEELRAIAVDTADLKARAGV